MEIKLHEALKSIVWYNGLSPVLEEWLELEPDKGTRSIKEPYYDKGYDQFYKAQVQILWMFCVLMFGDYGTSPRYGWIENVEGFRKFIKSLIHEDEDAD